MKTNPQSIAFFIANAGYNHSMNETREQGQLRCATALADAELWALEAGVSFSWDIDPEIDSSDWDSENEPHATWACLAYDAQGTVIGSLGGVDFGPEGNPHASTYRRVVEAEIALEAKPQVMDLLDSGTHVIPSEDDHGL
jgi:hypothetical protein